jgi:uncharacterized pyridoxamine 5'-phosphate oxidase family protein
MLLAFTSNAKAQNHQLALETGYNRIGVFFNPNIGIDIQNHQIHFGLKTYGYNLFFKSAVIGPQVGYQFQFEAIHDKVYFYPAISFTAYREEKSSSNLLLSEVNLKYGLGVRISNNIAIINELGVGYIMSNSNLYNQQITVKSAYPSFEISIGLVFHLDRTASM